MIFDKKFYDEKILYCHCRPVTVRNWPKVSRHFWMTGYSGQVRSFRCPVENDPYTIDGEVSQQREPTEKLRLNTSGHWAVVSNIDAFMR
jgi:hypothetical protein